MFAVDLQCDRLVRTHPDVSDRVLALNYGRPLAMGTPGEVQSHPEVIRAYLGG